MSQRHLDYVEEYPRFSEEFRKAILISHSIMDLEKKVNELIDVVESLAQKEEKV